MFLLYPPQGSYQTNTFTYKANPGELPTFTQSTFINKTVSLKTNPIQSYNKPSLIKQQRQVISDGRHAFHARFNVVDLLVDRE